jgi:hypothetical protein
MRAAPRPDSLPCTTQALLGHAALILPRPAPLLIGCTRMLNWGYPASSAAADSVAAHVQ